MTALELKLNLPDRLARDAAQMGLLARTVCKICCAKRCALGASRNWHWRASVWLKPVLSR